MHLWIALGLLQAAASAPAPMDLTCTNDASPPVKFAFHVDLDKETFSVTRNGGAARTGSAESYGNRLVLEVPSGNPDAIPMYFINTDTMKLSEVSRAGASALTPVSEGTCTKAGS